MEISRVFEPPVVEPETLMGRLNLQDQEVEIDSDGLILV